MRYGSQTGRTAASRSGTTKVASRHRLIRAGVYGVEPLERRLLLTNVLRASIPAQIDPATTPQALFVPGVSATPLTTPAAVGTVGSSFFRFTVDDLAPGQTTTFSTLAGNAQSTDTALALYDGDGNLLRTADADSPAAGNESLSAALTSLRPYVLGVFSANLFVAGNSPFTLTVDTGAQRVNSTITIDAATGTAEFLANSGEDTFTDPADVNYFPINLTNVGPSATVALNPDGPDVQFFGELYRQDTPNAPWVAVGSGSGPTVSLTATPPAGGDDTDAQYMLATSPLNFNTAAQSYKVDVTSNALLAPTTVDPASATKDLGFPVPSGVGISTATTGPNTFLLGGSPKVFKVTASTTGPLKISGQGILFSPLISIYNGTGASLLAVASLTASGTVSTSINATAGSSYVIRLADDHNNNQGIYLVTATQSYAPTPVAAGLTPGQQALLPLDPSTGGAFFQITPPVGTDVLALTLTPDAGTTLTPEIVAVGPNFRAITRTAGAGQPVSLPIDLGRSAAGPVDVYVVGTSGTGTATLSYRAITIPRQLPVGQLPTQTIDLKTNKFSITGPSPGFGQISGAQFYEISPGANETLLAQGSGGAIPLLLRYVQNGNVLQLDDRNVAGASGSAQLSATLLGGELYGIAAMPLNADGGGTIQQTVVAAAPAGVGIQMVPDPPPPQIPTMSKMRIRNVVLTSSYQRDLFQTLLPYDITGNPVVTFTPVHAGFLPGPLTATVTVLDDANNVIASGTSTPGTTLTLNLPAVTPGQELRFLVEPVNGQPLGDGIYNLEMDVTTSDPTPFIITEPSFNPPELGSSKGTLPFGLKIVNLPFGGTASGNFTSSSPYYTGGFFGNTGSIAVYAFTLPDLTTPFEVYTQDLSPNVNTTIGLFYGHYSNGSIDRYDALPFTAPNLDYFQADRSQVDAKIVINNYHILDNAFTGAYAPGANTLYVVVKNEQATQGQFQIGVRAIPTTLVGPGSPDSPLTFGGQIRSLVIDPEIGTGSVGVGGANDVVEFSTPSTFSSGSTAIVTVQPFNGNADTVFIDVYTADQFHFLLASASQNGGGLFQVPIDGLSSSTGYFMRVHFASGKQAGTVSVGILVNSPNPRPSHADPLASGSVQNISQFEPYAPASPDPGGTIRESNGGLDLFGPGTQEKTLFTVNSSGQSDFSINTSRITNETFALYRVTAPGSVEFPSFVGQLVDYASSAASGATLTFSDYLFAGTYYLKLVGTAPDLAPPPLFSLGGSFDLTAHIPAYNASQIILDPNSAVNDTDALRTPDDNAGFFGFEFYQVTAPGAVQSPITVDLTSVPGLTYGQYQFAVWKQQVNPGATTYSYITGGSLDYDFANQPLSTVLTGHDTPKPGDQYFIGISRDRVGANLLVGPDFTIPQSGDPNLVVTSLVLAPDNGRTRVTATVVNRGFAVALPSNATLAFSNYLKPPAIPGTQGGPSIIQFAAIGQYGNVVYSTNYNSDWKPDAPSNTASFNANYDLKTPEISYTDNKLTVALSTVDAHAPTVSPIALSDPALNGEGNSGTWGRYVSGVLGAPVNILATGQDVDNDLYQVTVTGPFISNYVGSDTGFNPSHTDVIYWDLGMFQPTSPANPNQIHYSAIDAYGLSSGDHVQKVDAVVRPGFLTSIAWDPAAKRYNIAFVHNFVDYDKTLSQILGLSVPLVGDKHNQFLVGVSAMGTASLDPSVAVSLPLTGRILLKALDSSIYDKSFTGSAQVSDHLTVKTTLAIDSHSLNATAAAVSFQLTNLNLFHYQTPLITLYSYGLPGIASIDIAVRFGIDADLSAGVKVGIDPNVFFNPLIPTVPLGLLSPTFVQPTITGSATVEGDVNVLGFPLASMQGTVSLGLRLTIGLDNNDPAKVFAFDDFFNHLAVKVDAILGIHLEADQVPFGDIWDYDYSKTFPVADSSKQGIITNDPGGGNGPGDAAFNQIDKFLLDPGSLVAAGAADGVLPVVRHGSDRVGPHVIDPTPQIVIDPASGEAISVQVKNVSADPTVTTTNLVYSARANGQWSALTALPSADVANPTLAFSHDGGNLNPAVVVYEADNGAADPATQSINQRLLDNEIRYRYYDGQGNWSAEQSITQDSLYDSNPSLAFNKMGAGVVAWVHNTAATPMDESGNYARDTQDIQAAVWDPATHTFSAPISITAGDGIADSKPAAFVDADGNPYVVWVRDTAAGNTLMFSVYDGANWSTPAVLPISGLTPGGNFGSVAIGTDQLGRIDVLFSYRIQNPDGSIDSRLYNRLGTKAQFGSITPVEQIAQDGNFSHLRTTNAGDGSLVAYWQLGDGVSNGVYASVLARSAANPSLPWSAPTRLTSTTDLTMAPSLAIDANGAFDVLYADQVAKGAAGPAGVSDMPVGVPMAPGVGSSSMAVLPELTFSNGLFFPLQDSAAVGTNTTGQATIVNRGLAPALVTINWYSGTPDNGTLLGTAKITLGAGKSYDFVQPFPVAAGQQTYSVQVSSANGEAVSTADDVSTATLNGLPDISVASLTKVLPFGPPVAGQSLSLSADVKNLSTATVGPFDVTLYSGDPRFPQTAPVPIATRTVQTLGPNGDVSLSFSLTLPNSAGNYVYTVVADSGHVIAEAVKSNNDAQYYISFRADPAISGDITHFVFSMQTQLLDLSGVNNVKVLVPIGNLGNVPIANVQVDLQSSRNGSPFVDVGNMTIPNLNPSQTTTVTFVTSGLEGDNVYRAFIDPSLNGQDSTLLNNTAQAELVIHGLADLTVGSLSLSNPNPNQGDPLSVNAVVSNLGIADAPNTLVEVFAQDPSGNQTLVGSTRVDVAAVGSSNLSIPIDTTSLLGQYTLIVQVNRLHEVLETTELNDTASIAVTFGAQTTKTNNVINGTAGIANTITLRRDPSDSTKDDVWINVAETEVPTQLAVLAQPTVLNGGGLVDKLVLDAANGDPLPVELDLNGSFTTDSLAINANESVVLSRTAALGGNQLTLSGLTIDPAAKLDVSDGSVVLTYSGASPLAAIQGYLKTGSDSGKWDGQGITSSSAASSQGAMGVADVDSGAVIQLSYRRVADTNGDGVVNFTDLVALAAHYGTQAEADWSNGDFNYDGKVTFADLVALAANYGKTALPGATPAASSGDLISRTKTKSSNPVKRSGFAPFRQLAHQRRR